MINPKFMSSSDLIDVCFLILTCLIILRCPFHLNFLSITCFLGLTKTHTLNTYKYLAHTLHFIHNQAFLFKIIHSDKIIFLSCKITLGLDHANDCFLIFVSTCSDMTYLSMFPFFVRFRGRIGVGY